MDFFLLPLLLSTSFSLADRLQSRNTRLPHVGPHTQTLLGLHWKRGHWVPDTLITRLMSAPKIHHTKLCRQKVGMVLPLGR